MSQFFDLMLFCDLREDTPEDIIEAMRCLTTHNYPIPSNPQLILPDLTNAWDYFSGNYHFLAPDPRWEIISNFRRMHRSTIPLENNREVHCYSLSYLGRNIHDDYFYQRHVPFVAWLGSVAVDGCIGYWEGSYSPSPRLLYAKNRTVHYVDANLPD